MKTQEQINDLIRAQCENESPYPPGGFETVEQLEVWREWQENRFLELTNRPQQWNFKTT